MIEESEHNQARNVGGEEGSATCLGIFPGRPHSCNQPSRAFQLDGNDVGGAPAISQTMPLSRTPKKLQRLEQSLVSRLSKLEELEKASKPDANQPFRIAHDDRYRTLAEHALDPKVGSTETVGASLMNQIKLPECVNTSVWLTPLIDSRMWYGEPRKPFVDLPLYLQEKYATKELKDGSTTN